MEKGGGPYRIYKSWRIEQMTVNSSLVSIYLDLRIIAVGNLSSK